MSKVQSKSVNNWAYFQSKSNETKSFRNTIEILGAQLLSTITPAAKNDIEKKIVQYKGKVEKYEKKK